MASISNEQFLLACVESLDGKINFKEVANKLGMKENACRMRWSRYKAKVESSAAGSNGGTTLGDGDESGPNGDGILKKTPKKTPAKKATPKKRKVDETGDDDEEKIKAEEQ